MSSRIIGARKVTRKIAYIGDTDECQAWQGRADSLLQELEERVLRSPLKLNMGSLVHTAADGVVIECKVLFDKRQKKPAHTIAIFTGGAYDRRETYFECFCTCHLSHGYVINQRFGCYDLTADITYDVVICARKELYIFIEGAIPLFRQVFQSGQSVLLLYEPVDLDDPYESGMDGCSMTQARITNIQDDEYRFVEKWLTK